MILQNESSNNGRMAHCYYDGESGTWLAYGKSAYVLRLMVKSAGQDNLRSYSYDLDTTCAMVGNNTLMELCQTNRATQHSDEHICLVSTEPIDPSAYSRWEYRLKQERKMKRKMWVDTHISERMGTHSSIKDGMSPFERSVKRLSDVIFSAFALVIFSPLFAITYLMVRLEDGGPAIFKQERLGYHGKPFYIYKFRSMRTDAEKFGPQLSHSCGQNDTRLTKVGRFIRAHHLDELPQLWNVLKGDMAFVGPRPERKVYIDRIMEYDKRYSLLYQMRPGVTSYATLYNGYTDTMEKMLRRLELDLYYLNHRSWWFDFNILFNTFCSIVFGKKF